MSQTSDPDAHESVLRRELISVSKQRAAQLAGITLRQLDYWDDHGVTHPSVTRQVGRRRMLKLYDYGQLISLQVAAELRHRDTSLQHIRRIVERLRAEGYADPLRQVRYAFDHAGHVYFDVDGDDGWEGEQLAHHYVIAEVLDLEPMDARIVAALRRAEESYGRIEKRRGTMGSKPVFAGTRVPVDTVRRYLQSGRTVDDIIAAFPILSEADVTVAAQG